MEKEVKSPNEVVVESETVVQPVESKPKKRVGLAIMLVVLVLLLVGGTLALGYLWGKNNNQNQNTTSSQQNCIIADNPSVEKTKEDNNDKPATENIINPQNQEASSDISNSEYLYISNDKWGVKAKVKVPDIVSFAYANDRNGNIYVWGHKYNQGEQAVPTQGTIYADYNANEIKNPVYLGVIKLDRCDYPYSKCDEAIFKSNNGTVGLLYIPSSSAAEKYSSNESWASFSSDYAASVAADVEILKNYFTNPDNYIVIE